MPQPVSLKFGPFTQGLNDSLDAALLSPEQASYALGVDLSSATLQGFWSPGNALTTVTAGSVSLAWTGNAQWSAASYPQWALNDAPDRNTGAGVTYLTQQTSGAASQPVTLKGSTSYPLGINAPTQAPTPSLNGGSTGLNYVNYAVTFVTSDGHETNPSPKTGQFAASGQGVKLTGTVPSDSRITGMRVYATLLNDAQAAGTLYLTQNQNPLGWTTTVAAGQPYSFTDSSPGSTRDQTTPLNWGPNGNPSTPALVADHSPAPNLTILSDGIHAVAQGAGTPGSGIMFGAINNSNGGTVWWSMLGYPDYWPTSNYLGLPEQILALTTSGTQTLALTANSIYAFVGASDTSLSVQRVNTEVGVLPGAGKTVSRCPYGVLFLSREGLALFDGVQTRIISQGMINPSTLAGGGFTHGRYYDRCYFLFGTSYTLVFDMRDFPMGPIKVTREATVATASHVTPYSPTGGNPGLYVCDSSGNVKPWRPTDLGNVAGSARETWQWVTGKLTAGAPNSPKIWRRVFYRGVGPVTFSFTRNGEASPIYTKSVADASVLPSNFWLPDACRSHSLTITIQGAASNSQLYDFRIEGEVRDGA